MVLLVELGLLLAHHFLDTEEGGGAGCDHALSVDLANEQSVSLDHPHLGLGPKLHTLATNLVDREVLWVRTVHRLLVIECASEASVLALVRHVLQILTGQRFRISHIEVEATPTKHHVLASDTEIIDVDDGVVLIVHLLQEAELSNVILVHISDPLHHQRLLAVVFVVVHSRSPGLVLAF